MTREQFLDDLRAALSIYRRLERGPQAPAITRLVVSRLSRDGRITVTLAGHYDNDRGERPINLVLSGPLEELGPVATMLRERLEYYAHQGGRSVY